MLRSCCGGIWQIKGLWGRVRGGGSRWLKPVLLPACGKLQTLTVESSFWSYFYIFLVFMKRCMAFIMCSIRFVSRVNHLSARDGHPWSYSVPMVWF